MPLWVMANGAPISVSSVPTIVQESPAHEPDSKIIPPVLYTMTPGEMSQDPPELTVIVPDIGVPDEPSSNGVWMSCPITKLSSAVLVQPVNVAVPV